MRKRELSLGVFERCESNIAHICALTQHSLDNTESLVEGAQAIIRIAENMQQDLSRLKREMDNPKHI